MKLKVFTLRLNETSGVFDDSELQAFLSERDAIAVDQHFFVHDGVPRWALLVHHREAAVRERGKVAQQAVAADWRSELSNVEVELFNALRSWRNTRARRDGRPAFVLFTNRQLAEIAKVVPRTLTELATVHGVGDARVRDYGDSVLAVVREALGTGVGNAATPAGGGEPAPGAQDSPATVTDPASDKDD